MEAIGFLGESIWREGILKDLELKGLLRVLSNIVRLCTQDDRLGGMSGMRSFGFAQDDSIVRVTVW